MAALTGFYLQDLILAQNPGRSANLDDQTADPHIWFGEDLASTNRTGGAVTDNQPVDEIEKVLSSLDTVRAFSEDWYNRIHVIPLSIALGNILSSQTREFEIWNAYFISKTLASIAPAGNQGLILTEPGATPLVYTPLASKIYSLQITTVGPGTVLATYAFDFPEEDPLLHVTGTRVVVFPFGPNYRSNFREQYQFSTDILESKNGLTENRIARRRFPFRVFEYEILVTGSLSGLFDSLLWAWQSNLFAVPYWPDARKLSADISLGATVLDLDTADTDIHVGGALILWLNETETEAVEVASFTATQVTIVNGVQRLYKAGTWVIPSRIGRLQTELSARTYSRDITSPIVLRFRIEEEDATPGIESVDTYRSQPFYTRQPQWASSITNTYHRKVEVLDNLAGFRDVQDIAGRGFFSRRYHHVFKTRAEVYAFKNWLIARKGRQKGTFIATWTRDLILAKTIASSDANIDVENAGYQQFIEQDFGRRDIEIVLKDGTAFRRRIDTSNSLTAFTERIGITTSLGQQVEMADVDRISYLIFARLVSDSMEIIWQTPFDIAESTFSMRVLTDDV